MKTAVLLLAVCALQVAGLADEPIKISTIKDASEPSSAEMMKLLRGRFGAHSNLFRLVSTEDASPGLVLQADCTHRKGQDPYVCFYTVQYSGTNSKTFMGGGITTAKTAGGDRR